MVIKCFCILIVDVNQKGNKKTDWLSDIVVDAIKPRASQEMKQSNSTASLRALWSLSFGRGAK